MAGLHLLPDEILLDITQQLTIKDLAALSVQCRRLNRLVDMPCRSRFHRMRLRRSDNFKDTSLLLEILRQPRLGQYVRELEVSTYSVCGIRVQPFKKPETEDADLIAAAIRAAGFSDDRKETNVMLAHLMRGGGLVMPGLFWDDPKGTSYMWGFDESMAILLMVLCPNIELLKVGGLSGPLGEFVKRANSRKNPSGHLRNLREVRLITESWDERFYQGAGLLDTLMEYHRLPSIESISVKNICHDQEYGRRSLTPRQSNFSKINIEHSVLPSGQLCSIIRHSKVLEEFRYAVGGRGFLEAGDTGPSFSPESVGAALQRHKSSLRVLDLDCSDSGYGGMSDSDSDEEDSDDDSDDSEEEKEEEEEEIVSATAKDPIYDTTIGSFHDFTALTHISIGVDLLLGQLQEWRADGWNDIEEDKRKFRLVDRLPPKLQYLCLRGFEKGENDIHTRMIDEMMEMRAVHLPCLKEVLGVDECIPHSESVESPDDEEELLFEDTDSWGSLSSDNESNSDGDGDDNSD